MSLDRGIGQNGWYEQIAAEFVKYECLSYPGPPNKKIMEEMHKAYTEMAKTLGLADIQTVKTEVSNMKKYIYKTMRRSVRLAIMNGGGGQDALNYAPPWFKLLDPHMKLFKLACRMETLQTLKHYNTGNGVGHLTSEIVRCACRAAARELAKDCTNGGDNKPSKNSTKGGSRGLAGNRTNGKASKLAKGSTNRGVSAIGSHNTNEGARDLDSGLTNGGVSDSAIDSTDRAVRAAIALVSEDAVREYAESVNINVNILHSIWTRIYAQSIHKLMSLIAAGDQASEKYAPIDWIVADAGLLYDARLTVVIDKTFQSSVTLHPLILLYKLMVAAHEKMKEIKTLPNLMGKNIVGAQTGTLENSNINIPSSSDKSIPDKDTSERNSVGEMRVDANKSNDLETESPRDTYELDRSRHIWAMVHLNYILSGRSSSAVLLQRRWYEMKQKTRQLLAGKDAPLSPSPILLALAKQFPSILTEKLPPWSELVLDNLIYQDSQLEPYRRLYTGIRLEVPNEIGENLIFDDLYDWSDDEVEVIDEKRETILVPDSDDEETDKVTNEQTDTSVNNTTIDNNTSELNDEYFDSIKKLESIDPTKAKVRIIFENDSDDDLNDFIHGVNDPGASKNTNSNKTNVIEGLNLKSRESIYLSDDNDSDENILNTNNKLLEVTQTYEINDIKNNENNKTNVINSVSNEIETQVRSDNHNKNVGIDMDEVICDLRNNLIRDSSKVSNKDTQTINTDTEGDSDTADEMCDGGDEPSRDDEGERPGPLLVDKKLVQLSHVVLTPIEDLPEWRKHSRNNTIKCRQFSVKNFTKKVHVTSKQLENCRPYISKKSNNGIWFRKNQELRQIPKDIRKKINILSKRLNLSRTYFSQEFWSERNLELMELCRPCSVQLKRIPRVVKKIKLADIDDVRRINRTILTAQVAPITVETNRMFVIDPAAPSTTAERVQQSSGHKTNTPSNLTVVQENEKISDSVAEENLPTPNLLEQSKILDSNLEKDELPTESDVKEMIKTIVRKGHLPKASDTAFILKTQDFDYYSKQKDLEKDLRQISKVVLMNFKRPENKTSNKRKNIKSVKTQPNPTPNVSTLNSLEEWKRQKQQNLVYFNLNTNLEVKKSDKHVNQYTNKKKKDKNGKSNAEVNLHKDNDKQSKDTSEISDANDCSENAIKRTSSELNQYTNKKKKDNEDKSKAEVNLHKDNDKQSKDTSEISDSSDCSENVIKRTSSELNQYTNKIKKDEKDKSNAEVNLHKENEGSQSKDTCKISDSSDCSENVIKRTSSELNQYTNKIKKDEKDKSNAEVNLHKENEGSQSKDTCKISDSSDCSENVIKRTSSELNQYTNKIKKDEKDKSNAEVNLHKENEGSQSKDTCKISDSSDCSENVIKRTSSELNQYTNKIKKDEKDKSNAEVNLHKENEGSQSKDTCKISDSSDCSEKVIKRPCCGLVIEVPSKSPRLEINDKAINAPSDVIEVSDDSSDRDIKIMSNVQSNNIITESSNNQNKSQVTVNIIKNTIKIVGSGSNKQQKNKEKNAISFLSKVAANIQKNVAPASPQNNNVFYVVKNSESDLTKTILDTNARGAVVKTNSDSNSTYYVVNIPDNVTGSNKTIISPLPESTTQMPVIQSVSSLSQLSHQSLNQMPPDVIDLNQAFPNQIQPVINLNRAFQNQIQPVINLNQVIHNQINPVINLNQAFHNQINPVIDLNQASLNQNPPSIYIYQPSPNQAPPLIDINQPSVNQILPQNEMSHIYPNQVLTVSPLPNQTSHNQTNSANHTVVGNAFENLVKRPSNNQFQNTNSQPVGIPPMPLIQSVSSLRQIDQQNIPKNTKPQIMPIRSVTSRPVKR